MSDQTKPDTSLLSRQIARSAERLARLVEINAPAPIIENERRLLAGRVLAFPVASSEVCKMVDDARREPGGEG
jgi:DNA-directed RNA polymerase beta' subunit